MPTDQASTLRRMVNQQKSSSTKETRKRRKQKVRVITITSGKGGVGKTNIAINLAYALSTMGKKVFLFDADLGLANIDVLLNLTPRYTVEHVLSGKKNIDDIIVSGPNNIQILPSSSGVSDLAELSRENQVTLFRKLSQIDQQIDYLIIDTGAGIASNVLRFTATADEIFLVATPEPTSMTDTYSMIKVLTSKYNVRKFNLIANAVESKTEAYTVYQRLQKVAYDFLQMELHYAGFIFKDPMLIKAVKRQKPLLELYPRAQASKCFFSLAKRIDTHFGSMIRLHENDTETSFWDRFLQWKKSK